MCNTSRDSALGEGHLTLLHMLQLKAQHQSPPPPAHQGERLCPCTCTRLSQICSAATRDPVKGWSALLSAEAAPLPSPLPFLGKSPWATTHQVQKEEKSQPSAHFRCHHTHFSLSLPAPNFTTDGPALGPGKEAQHRVLFCPLP